MVALLRAIARSGIYRAHLDRLSRRQPDDVWHDPQYGWIVTYPLAGEQNGGLLVFALREPSADGRATVSSARRVVRAGDGVISALLFPNDGVEPSAAEA